MLAEHYNPATHARQLANCCFKCHIPQIYQAYNEFRLKVQPNLTEPRISNIYTNSQFVDLRTLIHNKEDMTLRVPDPCIEPFPNNLANILDELFERYGFIPHLERFLLYYPSYLEKHRAV